LVVTKPTREILERALALPPAERVKLAQELLGSVLPDLPAEDELDAAFVTELRRRAERFLSGKAKKGIAAEEALAEIERRLERRRRTRGQTG
jgi:putative addiction module component (TIGR02574 family)